MKNNIAIIPARGGSKRLPKKNVLPLLDKALIQYSIDYAKHSLHIVDRIIVTTDDEDIKQLALKNKVEVVDRPKELAVDNSTTVSALKHVLLTLKVDKGNVILLQPTNPLRPKNLLNEAYNQFTEQNFDSLMTVTRNSDKLGKINNQKFIPFNYEMGQRSQDLEPLYFENGLLYITKASFILNDVILAENNCPFIVNHPYAKVDIDNEEDFKLAEFILQNYSNE